MYTQQNVYKIKISQNTNFALLTIFEVQYKATKWETKWWAESTDFIAFFPPASEIQSLQQTTYQW